MKNVKCSGFAVADPIFFRPGDFSSVHRATSTSPYLSRTHSRRSGDFLKSYKVNKMSIASDKIDDLLRAITDLSSVLQNCKPAKNQENESDNENEDENEKEMEDAPPVKNPYAVIEIHRFYNDVSAPPKGATKGVIPKGAPKGSSGSQNEKNEKREKNEKGPDRCPGGSKCPCAYAYGAYGAYGAHGAHDTYAEEQDEPTALEALLEFVVTVGLILWISWMLSNLVIQFS